MLIEELYEALIEAGASEEKAKAAARAIADYERRVAGMESELVNVMSLLSKIRIALLRNSPKTD